MGEFKITSRTTKEEIIEQYKELLTAYKKKVGQLTETEKRLSEKEKQRNSEVLSLAKSTSVQGVIEGIGQLRSLVNHTLNELTARMSEKAEKLEGYQRALSLQEQRLQELYDLESSADAYGKLVHAFEEHQQEVEGAFSAKTAGLEHSHQERAKNLDREFLEKKQQLEKEMISLRAAWAEEQKQMNRALAEEKENIKKARQREEADFIYQRDKARKMDEDSYQARQHSQERELAEKKLTVESALAQRERMVVEKETELFELQQQVEAFPAQLEQEVERAHAAATATMEKEMRQKAELLALERDWERRMLEQQIQHLEGTISAQNKKLEELHAELNATQGQVHEMAKRAIEGASLSKAFPHVAQLSMDSMRRMESKSSE